MKNKNIDGKKVAFLVANDCNPDFRVIKEAESLVKAGNEVRIFCMLPIGSNLPKEEMINGVLYIRKNIFDAERLFGVFARFLRPILEPILRR